LAAIAVSLFQSEMFNLKSNTVFRAKIAHNPTRQKKKAGRLDGAASGWGWKL
jgi:hypothetical protein